MLLVTVVILALAFWAAMLAQAIHALHRHDAVMDALVRQFGQRLERVLDAQLKRFEVPPDVRRRISSL